MGPLDRLWLWRLRARCEAELVRRGGDELVCDARTEASWYADLHHPWSCPDTEPDLRVNAWYSILVARTLVARHRDPLDGCPLHD